MKFKSDPESRSKKMMRIHIQRLQIKWKKRAYSPLINSNCVLPKVFMNKKNKLEYIPILNYSVIWSLSILTTVPTVSLCLLDDLQTFSSSAIIRTMRSCWVFKYSIAFFKYIQCIAKTTSSHNKTDTHDSVFEAQNEFHNLKRTLSWAGYFSWDSKSF